MTSRGIYDRILADIVSGKYAREGRLPGEIALAASFGVSRMTLRAALEKLRLQGLIETRNGAGSFLTKRAARRSGIIGLIIPDYESCGFFSVMKGEIERHAVRLGYRISLVSTQGRDNDSITRDIRRKARQLAVNRVEGVIFRPFISGSLHATNCEIVSIMRHAEVPVVLIDSDITRPPERSDCDLVAVNNIGAGRQIAEHLWERGCRHVAFLLRSRNLSENTNWGNRLFGLAGQLALLGCDESVRRLDFSPADAAALGALMRSRRRPDVIVCGNDEQAAQLIETLRSLGRRVPDDVGVVGFDDIDVARSTTPPLTTISQPVRRLAAMAFKVLLARIRYPNNDPREILLDAPLVVRKSG